MVQRADSADGKQAGLVLPKEWQADKSFKQRRQDSSASSSGGPQPAEGGAPALEGGDVQDSLTLAKFYHLDTSAVSLLCHATQVGLGSTAQRNALLLHMHAIHPPPSIRTQDTPIERLYELNDEERDITLHNGSVAALAYCCPASAVEHVPP